MPPWLTAMSVASAMPMPPCWTSTVPAVTSPMPPCWTEIVAGAERVVSVGAGRRRGAAAGAMPRRPLRRRGARGGAAWPDRLRRRSTARARGDLGRGGRSGDVGLIGHGRASLHRRSGARTARGPRRAILSRRLPVAGAPCAVPVTGRAVPSEPAEGCMRGRDRWIAIGGGLAGRRRDRHGHRAGRRSRRLGPGSSPSAPTVAVASGGPGSLPSAAPSPTRTPSPTDAEPEPVAEPDAQPVAHGDPGPDADPQPDAVADPDAVAAPLTGRSSAGQRPPPPDRGDDRRPLAGPAAVRAPPGRHRVACPGRGRHPALHGHLPEPDAQGDRAGPQRTLLLRRVGRRVEGHLRARRRVAPGARDAALEGPRPVRLERRVLPERLRVDAPEAVALLAAQRLHRRQDPARPGQADGREGRRGQAGLALPARRPVRVAAVRRLDPGRRTGPTRSSTATPTPPTRIGGRSASRAPRSMPATASASSRRT